MYAARDESALMSAVEAVYYVPTPRCASLILHMLDGEHVENPHITGPPLPSASSEFTAALMQCSA